MTKLQKKLQRQAKQTEKLMTGYSLNQKGTTRRTHSKGNLWNHNNLGKITQNIL